MSQQVQQERQKATTHTDDAPTADPAPQPAAQRLSQETADLIDEIDELLGSEAEVQVVVDGFVQKGGQ
jgi:ubiquitin-like protein Pup